MPLTIRYESGRLVVRHAGGWDESKHPRGNPENAGQFAKKGGGRAAPTGLAAEAAGLTGERAEAMRALVGRVREDGGVRGEHVRDFLTLLHPERDSYKAFAKADTRRLEQARRALVALSRRQRPEARPAESAASTLDRAWARGRDRASLGEAMGRAIHAHLKSGGRVVVVMPNGSTSEVVAEGRDLRWAGDGGRHEVPLPMLATTVADGHARVRLEPAGAPRGAVDFRPPAFQLEPNDPDRDRSIRTRVAKTFGRELPLEAVAALSGAGEGDVVSLEDYARVTIHARGEHYDALREVEPGPDGPVLRNEELSVDEAHQGRGLGLGIFFRQVEAARALGVVEMRTLAAGGPGDEFNGYYTWPRLGYDAGLPEDIRGKLPASLAGADRVSDLMRSEEGRAWWKANGKAMEMTFDLRQGSRAVERLRAYAAERAARAAEAGEGTSRPGSAPTTTPSSTGSGTRSRHARGTSPVRYESGVHAPKGGATIGGTFYPGGQFIPGHALESATPAERVSVGLAMLGDGFAEGIRGIRRASLPQDAVGALRRAARARLRGLGRETASEALKLLALEDDELGRPAESARLAELAGLDLEAIRRGEGPPPSQPRRDHALEEDFARRKAAHDDYARLGTTSPAFLAWFGDWEREPSKASKVVDAETGAPKVVYHGTESGGFDEFRTPAFFSESRAEAVAYTEITDTDADLSLRYEPVGGRKLPEAWDPHESWPDYWDYSGPANVVALNGNTDRLFYWPGTTNPVGDRDIVVLSGVRVDDRCRTVYGPTEDDEGAEPRDLRREVHAAYLNIRNPIELPWDEANLLGRRLGARDEEVAEKVAAWVAQGHDGIVTESDDARVFAGRHVRQWIAFHPNQVKAVDNAGTFDPADPRIRHGRRLVLRLRAGRLVVRHGRPDPDDRAGVPARIAAALAGLPPMSPGYGQVLFNPETGVVRFVSGDGDGREACDAWRRALAAVPGVERVESDAEHLPAECGRLREARPPWVMVGPARRRTDRLSLGLAGGRLVVRYERGVHAPSGGATIGGTFYPGGQFIPGRALASATADERKRLGLAKTPPPTPAQKRVAAALGKHRAGARLNEQVAQGKFHDLVEVLLRKGVSAKTIRKVLQEATVGLFPAIAEAFARRGARKLDARVIAQVTRDVAETYGIAVEPSRLATREARATRSERPPAPGALAAVKRVGADAQRHAEAQEFAAALKIGGINLPDNEPPDILVPGPDGRMHGVETKTKTTGADDKVFIKDTLDAAKGKADMALTDKAAWLQADPRRMFHTVVFDHRDRFDDGRHRGSYSGHPIYYRRGVGVMSVAAMYPARDYDELRELILMDDKELAAWADDPKADPATRKARRKALPFAGHVHRAGPAARAALARGRERLAEFRRKIQG